MTTDVEDWTDLATSEVSDALDRLGIAGQIHRIHPLDRSFRLLGRAFTVRYGPSGATGGTVGDYIDDVPPGSVIVLDNRGRDDITVWGDLLTLTAHRQGMAGTVVDGVCRDTDRALALRYPLYARGRWMRTGKDRVRVEEIQRSVSCGGVRIEPGDLLLGDGDGVLAVPAIRAGQTLAQAREIADAEQRIRDMIAAGERLTAARAAVGYHTLQSRQ